MVLEDSVWLPELDSDDVTLPLGELDCELVQVVLPLPDEVGVVIPLGVLEPEPDGDCEVDGVALPLGELDPEPDSVCETEGDAVPLIDALCERVAADEEVPEPVGVWLVLWVAV